MYSIFNKIAIQSKETVGQGSHWLIERQDSNDVTHPDEMFVDFVSKHSHTASIYTISRSFVPFVLSKMVTKETLKTFLFQFAGAQLLVHRTVI